MWSGAWNKVHFRNLLPSTYRPSTVSRAQEWWSRGHGFNAHLGQFQVAFILLYPVNFWQICHIFLSWKTRLSQQWRLIWDGKLFMRNNIDDVALQFFHLQPFTSCFALHVTKLVSYCRQSILLIYWFIPDCNNQYVRQNLFSESDPKPSIVPIARSNNFHFVKAIERWIKDIHVQRKPRTKTRIIFILYLYYLLLLFIIFIIYYYSLLFLIILYHRVMIKNKSCQ